MANFNFDFEKYYRPILEQSGAVGDATNQLTGFQQGQGTAMMDLQKTMQQVSEGYKTANAARNSAVGKVAGGSGQYYQQMSDTINPMARQSLSMQRSGQDVAQLAGANTVLSNLGESDQNRLGNAMQFRNSEEARLAGAVTAQKDRYTMLQDEFNTAYQMEADAWSRDLQERQLAVSGAGVAEQKRQNDLLAEQNASVATANTWNSIYEKAKADATMSVWDETAQKYIEQVDPAKLQDGIWGELNSGMYDNIKDVDVNLLHKAWSNLDWVRNTVTWATPWSNGDVTPPPVVQAPAQVDLSTSTLSPMNQSSGNGELQRGQYWNDLSKGLRDVGFGIEDTGKEIQDVSYGLGIPRMSIGGANPKANADQAVADALTQQILQNRQLNAIRPVQPVVSTPPMPEQYVTPTMNQQPVTMSWNQPLNATPVNPQYGFDINSYFRNQTTPRTLGSVTPEQYQSYPWQR